jgi:hypothetical protein
MKREDFIFTIGFQGDTAIIDGKAQRQFGRLSTSQLAEQGLYKQALCSALFAGTSEEIESFIAFYNRMAGSAYDRASICRLFGVYGIPDGIKRYKIIN